MDSGQTFDVVDTPHPDRREWPSFEDFSRDEVKKWRDIDIGPYKLLETFYQWRNKYGHHSVVLKLERKSGPYKLLEIFYQGRKKNGHLSVVLKLEHKNGTILQVWAFPNLVYAMERRGKTEYIWNHGQMKCEKTGNYFYDFSLS